MNNSDVKRQLRKPVYDESNSSFKFDEEDEMTVDKGINVDPSTFEHKKRILHDLAAIGQLVNVGHKFSLVTIKGKGEGSSKIQARFYTKHSASINVSVSRYSNGACYFGLRGSPVKILTGQNIIDTVDEPYLNRIRSDLKCSDFEAKSVAPFWMIRDLVHIELGKDVELFTASELKDLSERNIGIRSVTFAVHKQFGANRSFRNFNLSFLAYVAEATCNMEQGRFPLCSYLGVSTTAWRMDKDLKAYEEKQFSVPLDDLDSNTDSYKQFVITGRALPDYCGVMFLKEQDDHPFLVKQVYYLKDVHMDVKANSSKINKETLDGMSEEYRTEWLRAVRIDNSFNKVYLIGWINALFGLKLTDLTVRSAKIICDNEDIIRSLIVAITNEVGVRALMLGPSVNEIRAIRKEIGENSTEQYAAIFDEWLMTPVEVKTSKSGQKTLNWKNICASRTQASKFNKELMDEYGLDIRLPFDFYQELTHARQSFFYSAKERRAMIANDNGDSGVGSFSELIENAKKRTRREARMMTLSLRNEITIPIHITRDDTALKITDRLRNKK